MEQDPAKKEPQIPIPGVQAVPSSPKSPAAPQPKPPKPLPQKPGNGFFAPDYKTASQKERDLV